MVKAHCRKAKGKSLSLIDWFRAKNKDGTYKKRRFSLKRIFLAVALGLSGLAVASRGVDIIRHTPPDEAVVSIGMKAQQEAAYVAEGPRFPAYEVLPEKWRGVLERSGQKEGITGADIYTALTERQKACLLNIMAKSQATLLPDGTTVLDHMRHLREIRQDRIFITVEEGLAQQLDSSNSSAGAFYHRGGIDGVLHSARESFDKYASYKTRDAKGAFDVTLSHNGREWMAEMDIDYYRGMRHFFFEVAYNHVLDTRTDPVKVEKILRQNQGIDPGYKGR